MLIFYSMNGSSTNKYHYEHEPNKFDKNMKKTIATVVLTLCTAMLSQTSVFGQNNVKLTFNTSNRGALMGDMHYGMFFEEINRGGEGGLYAEMVHNRSFEENLDHQYADYWHATAQSTISIVTDNLMNDVQTCALKVVTGVKNAGVYNEGFAGMRIIEGETYKLSFWAKTETDGLQVSGKLRNEKGFVIGAVNFDKMVTNEWTKYSADIVATGSASKGTLAIVGNKGATFYLDVVSLFPPTFNNRENGMRPDIAQFIADLKPGFMRFPGGCFIEGMVNEQYPELGNNRFNWKETIGPIEERPGQRNQIWGYWVSNGLGFKEYLDFAEDIGAKPLFVVCAGMGHGWHDDYNNDIQKYIDEALDAIEYCNGDETTKYGKVRIEAGHPEPYNLQYIEIGNESYSTDIGTDTANTADHYPERYNAIRNAILEKYPDMNIIANGNNNNPYWPNSYPLDIIDEHLYIDSESFLTSYHKYDKNNFDRSFKIYVGEWASVQQGGQSIKLGDMRVALSEAIFLQGMEVNSDLCIMNSYAPMFQHEDLSGWWVPDLIHFNSTKVFGIPSYYLQKMFSNNCGYQNLLWKEENNSEYAEISGKTIDQKVYISSQISEDEKTIYLKITNPREITQDIDIYVDDKSIEGYDGEILTADSYDAENSIDNPTAVSTKDIEKVYLDDTFHFTYQSKPLSITVLRIKLSAEKTTSINSIISGKPKASAYYDLSGQRVSKDYHGVVIIKGEKFYQ